MKTFFSFWILLPKNLYRSHKCYCGGSYYLTYELVLYWWCVNINSNKDHFNIQAQCTQSKLIIKQVDFFYRKSCCCVCKSTWTLIRGKLVIIIRHVGWYTKIIAKLKIIVIILRSEKRKFLTDTTYSTTKERPIMILLLGCMKAACFLYVLVLS